MQIHIECTSTEVADLVSDIQLTVRPRELFSNEIPGVADRVCEIIQIWK